MERASSLGWAARTAAEMLCSGNDGGMIFFGCDTPTQLLGCLHVPANPTNARLHTAPCADTLWPHAAEDNSQPTSWLHSAQGCMGHPTPDTSLPHQLRHQPSPAVSTTTSSTALPRCESCSVPFTPTDKHHGDINDKCVERNEIR